MSNRIRIKRRLKGSQETSLPELYTGELAYDETKGKLYIGESDQNEPVAVPVVIGGSGYIIPTITGISPLKDGTGADGTWNINVTGNAGSVTNGVYTTGNQTIDGIKTFTSGILITTTGTSNGQGFNFVGPDGNGIYLPSGTIRTQDLRVDGWLTVGTKLDILSAAEILSRGPIIYNADQFIFNSGIGIFTKGLFVGPTGSPTGVSLSGHKHDYTDISNFCTGVASCVNTPLNAGSGLVLNYLEASGIYLDIGRGDGIVVSADAVSVDSTVTRNSGTQFISGIKTFFNTPTFNSGILSSGTNTLQVAAAASATQFVVFTGDPSSVSKPIYTSTPSEVKSDIGLGNVTNNIQVKQTTGGTNVGYIPTWNSTSGDLLGSGYVVSTDLATNSGSVYIPRADALVSYVNTAINNGIATNDAMIFKGAIDCSTNPDSPAADRGWTYKISVAGKIGGSSGPTVEVNDTIICSMDSTVAGIHADVGSNWVILQTNIVDSSILVTGPSSSDNGNIAIFDGITGKAITGSVIYQSGNNIGIGIQNPDQLLTVNGTIRSAAVLARSLAINAEQGLSPTIDIDVNSVLTDSKLLINNTNAVINLYDALSLVGGTDSVYIGSNAGAKTPVSTLDVSGVITASGGNSNNWNTAYSWGNHSSSGYARSSEVVKITGSQTITGNKTFGGSTTTVFTTGAKVGIGIDSPSYLLDIYDDGTNLSPFRASDSNNNYITIGPPEDGTNVVKINAIDKIYLTTNAGDINITGTVRINGETLQNAALGSATNGQLLIGNGSSFNKSTLTAGTGISITNASGSITINISGLQSLITNPVTGTGIGLANSGYISRWDSSSGILNSNIYQRDNFIGIGTTDPSGMLHVGGNLYTSGSIYFRNGNSWVSPALSVHAHSSTDIYTSDGTLINYGNTIDPLVYSIYMSSPSFTAGAILRRSDDNSTYTFSNELYSTTIDCGTF